MGQKDRMFLISEGPIFVIVNENRIEVSFSGTEDFYKYCPLKEFGVDVGSIKKLNYEPGRGFFIKDGEDLLGQGMMPEYENLIDHAQELLDRRQDPYYGLNLADAKIKKKALLRADGDMAVRRAWSLEDQGTDAQAVEKMESFRAAYHFARDAIDRCDTVDEVRAVAAKWPTPNHRGIRS